MKNKNAGELLKEKSELYISKSKEYGSTYKDFGKVAAALFPGGLKIITEDEWNRFGVYVMLIHKMMRISRKIFNAEISVDSIKDMQVYAAMLEELCNEDDCD